MSVLSNGRLVSVTKTADGRQQVWHWSQEKPASTYLYSIVAARFAVLHDSWRGIPVDYWVAPDTIDATWRTFGETPAMIETFSRVLGVNFPWAKYDQAIIPDFTYGGMENVSATTQTDLALHSAAGEPEWSGRGLDSHELAHQWFGDLTTTATWAHAWINEGITTYMESVHEEQSRGREAAQWNWINEQEQAMGADLNQERPLVFGEKPGTDPIQIFFSGHVYPKGAQLAHQLRRLVGDSLFWKGMKRFLTDNAYKPVETADYAIAMEKTTGRDLDWFFDQWAYGIGYPKVKVAREWRPATHTLHLTVDQTQKIDATHPSLPLSGHGPCDHTRFRRAPRDHGRCTAQVVRHSAFRRSDQLPFRRRRLAPRHGDDRSVANRTVRPRAPRSRLHSALVGDPPARDIHRYRRAGRAPFHRAQRRERAHAGRGGPATRH